MKLEEVIQKKEIKVWCGRKKKRNCKLIRHLDRKSQVGNLCPERQNVTGQVDMT